MKRRASTVFCLLMVAGLSGCLTPGAARRRGWQDGYARGLADQAAIDKKGLSALRAACETELQAFRQWRRNVEEATKNAQKHGGS